VPGFDQALDDMLDRALHRLIESPRLQVFSHTADDLRSNFIRNVTFQAISMPLRSRNSVSWLSSARLAPSVSSPAKSLTIP